MRLQRVFTVVLGCCAALGQGSACLADVRLPSIISDHMVLQQDGAARIWGWAEPGERVSVTFSYGDRVYQTEADPDGEWEVLLDTPESVVARGAGSKGMGPHTITIRADNEIVIQDVLVGEVWVASGQSNMQMSLDSAIRGVEGSQQELARADYPQIRFFQVRRRVSASPMDDCAGEWIVCSPKTIGPFSAVAYYFAQALHERRAMAVGLIGTYWGGTVIEAWMSPEALVDFPEFHDDLSFAARIARDPDFGDERFQQQLRQWEQRLGEADPGSKGAAFARVDLDDSDWSELTLPGLWESEAGFENFDGFVWYRREFEAPASLGQVPSRLTLGAIDDMDSVWINGELVGKTEQAGRHQQPRLYNIPPRLIQRGRNVIAIRVLDTGGAGGLTGTPEQMAISANGVRAQTVSLGGVWRAKRGAAMGTIPSMPRTAQMHQNRPTALSNAMIEPITPYTIRGAIWYQGESNRTRARQYRALMPAMIEDWRRRWGIEMPFYLVQIAPFAYGGDTGEAAELREAQMMAMDALDGVGVAVTMDVGNPRDIHPKKKKPVGYRLAQWALAKVYGVEIEYSGPIVETVDFGDGSARVSFAHGEGLEFRAQDASALFELAGTNGGYVRADSVEVVEGGLVVRAAGVGTPASIRYAWGAPDAGVLFNNAGLPASSFRWPIP